MISLVQLLHTAEKELAALRKLTRPLTADERTAVQVYTRLVQDLQKELRKQTAAAAKGLKIRGAKQAVRCSHAKRNAAGWYCTSGASAEESSRCSGYALYCPGYDQFQENPNE